MTWQVAALLAFGSVTGLAALVLLVLSLVELRVQRPTRRDDDDQPPPLVR